MSEPKATETRRQQDAETIRSCEDRSRRGERLTPEEFAGYSVALSQEEMRGIELLIFDERNSVKQAVGLAFARLLGVVAAHQSGAYRKRHDLEDRVAELERKLTEAENRIAAAAGTDKRLIDGKLRVVAGGKKR